MTEDSLLSNVAIVAENVGRTCAVLTCPHVCIHIQS
jgi:hypothetical protein